MKKTILVVTALTAFMCMATACGEKPEATKASVPASSQQAQVTEKPQATGVPAASEEPKASVTAPSSKKSKDLPIVKILSAKAYTSDTFPTVVFELKIENVTDKNITVGEIDFGLVTSDRQMLTSTLSSRGSNTTTILSGGKVDSFEVAFDYKDMEKVADKIEGMMFETEGFHVEIYTKDFPELVSGEKPMQEVPTESKDQLQGEVPLGGGVKADNYEN